MVWTPDWIPGLLTRRASRSHATGDRMTGRIPGLLTRRLFARRCPLCCVPETDGGLCRDCVEALPALGPHCRICCEPLAMPASLPAPLRARGLATPPPPPLPAPLPAPLCTRGLAASPPLPKRCLVASPLLAPLPLCARCLAAPPRYERVLAPCLYAPMADRMIREFKYGRRIEWAAPIGKMLARHVRAADGGLPGALVPVPLHRERLRRRGFNQSLEIARVLSAELGVRLEAACVAKTRRTVPQTALDAKRRRRNLNGAFHLRRRPRAQRVAIVDDVMTTGATVGEMAKVLARAGVAHIEVWVAARAAA